MHLVGIVRGYIVRVRGRELEDVGDEQSSDIREAELGMSRLFKFMFALANLSCESMGIGMSDNNNSMKYLSACQNSCCPP